MNKVTIDIEARFIDHVSNESKSASKSVEGIGKSASKAQKDVDNLSKKKAKPIFDADNNKFLSKVRSMESKMNKLGHKKTAAVLDIVDKATTKIGKVINKVQSFASKTWRSIIEFNDSRALNSIRKVTSGVENLTKKTWTTLVKVKDMALSPIRAIKNALFSIPTLITAVVSAKVVQKAILEPVSLADQYTNAKIGFTTLLGESRGQAMMDEIDAFAAATPFKTSNVISNVQKMMAYGWDAERVIDDMKTIGDAAAATGKGDEGLASIVYALSEIRTKGKLSTQELNQLASAGIKAKMYLAEGLGYGTSDEGLMKLAEDLEDGAIGANQAIELILQGMEEYDGMMDKMANTTVKGLKDQLTDLFEINVSRKWGQGLQEGLIKSFGSVTSLIDGAGDALSAFGDTMYELGKVASNWLAEKLEKLINKFHEITGSFEYYHASAGGKISMLWKGLIADPISNWWNGGGKEKVVNTAVDIGLAIGKFILKGITTAFNELPWWGKLLVGGYVGGKALSGIGNMVGGIGNLIGGAKKLGTFGKTLMGSTGNSMVSGSGLLGKLANVGYNTMGGAAAAAGMSGGKAALIGAAKVAGVAGTIYYGGKSIKSFYDAYKAHKSGDKTARNANIAEGAWTAGGTGAGALIGSLIFPGLGTWVGGALGGIIGNWIGGKHSKKIQEDAQKAAEEAQKAAEEAARKDLEKYASGYGYNAEKAILDGASEQDIEMAHLKDRWEDAKRHFGDIKLTTAEISRLTQQIVWGEEDLKYFEQFSAAARGAEESLQSFKVAAQDADRWMWKAGLGVKFNEDEKEAFVLSFSDYLSNARSLLENKHYNFAMAAEMVLDTESDLGKSLVEGVNNFYAQQQEELEAAGQELGDALTNAMADGIVSADEQEVITAAQTKVASIMEKIADTEMKAELELAKFKFESGNMDSESYKSLLETAEKQVQERIDAQDEAVKVVLSTIVSLKDNGDIDEATYKRMIEETLSKNELKIDEIKAEVMGFTLEPLVDAYDLDMDKVNSAIAAAIKHNHDPIEWSNQLLIGELDLPELTMDSYDNIKEGLSRAYQQGIVFDSYSYDANALFGEVDSLTKRFNYALTGKATIEGSIDLLASDFGISEEEATTVLWNISAEKSILDKIDYVAEEFGIEKEEAANVMWKLLAQASILNPLALTMLDFGILSEYMGTPTIDVAGKLGTLDTIALNPSDLVSMNSFSYNPTISVSPRLNYLRTLLDTNSVVGTNGPQKKYRGGIVGYSDGGMVRGGSQLIEVAEEGSPEMIIPLSSQRRGRALKLWAQAGNIMGVPGFARGGLTSGGNDEGIRFQSYDSRDTTAGGQSVQVDIGGLTFEINVNGGDSQSIIESIKAQATEIAEVVAGVLADSLGAQFENTPAKGGAY